MMQPAQSDYQAQAEAPFREWPDAFAYLKTNFEQGDHVAILGPTGTGKTHIALEIAEIRDYVLLIACKPKDPLIEDAIARGYYLVPTNKLEVPYVDGKPYHRKVIYWPRMPVDPKHPIPNHQLLAAERDMQKPLVAGALGYVRKNGHWAVILDEATWSYRDLGLAREIDSALTQFRTLKASLIVLAQRPAWTGRYTLSMPSFIILFQTSNGEDLKSLGDISGTDTKLVQGLVRNLTGHQFLFIDVRRKVMFRSQAPPR